MSLIIWCIIIGTLLLFGIIFTNLFFFLLSIILFFVSFIYSEYKINNSEKGRKQYYIKKEKQKKIEKEFGIIEYWEDK